MFKRIFICFFIIILVFGGFSTSYASGEIFDLKAKGAVLIDGTTGSLLYEHNSHERLPIASVTKIMTMLLTMEAIHSGRISYDDMIPVSEHAASMGGTQLWLEAGQEFSVRDMLKAVSIRSANDACVVLADKIAGSEEAFVDMMNEKAKELGMLDTHFLDSNGLTDEGQYSSAYDVALMSRELLIKYPEITKFTTKWHDVLMVGDKEISLDNTNKLLRSYDGIIGLKTGYTSVAGHNLSAAAKRNNLLLIAVVLGEPTSDTRFAESRKLLDYGFANFDLEEVNKKGEHVHKVNVLKGLKNEVNGVYGDDTRVLIKKGEKGKIDREIRIAKNITAPVKAGQKIGEVVFRIGDREVGRTPVVAEIEVEKASFMRLLLKMITQWFGIGRV